MNTDNIHTLEQAKSDIEQMTTLYNETKNKYNEMVKINSSLNLEILTLKDEVTGLQRVLRTRENNDLNGDTNNTYDGTNDIK